MAELTAKLLAQAGECDLNRAGLWLPHFKNTFGCYDIKTPLRQAVFLAQAIHESGPGFTKLSESLTYTKAERIVAVWPTRFTLTGELKKQDAMAFVRQPVKLAIEVYGGRMGNAKAPSNDGWDFRGGGIFQLTGKTDYADFQAATGIKSLSNPGVIRQLGAEAVMASGWEWVRSKLYAFADTGDIDTVSKKLNGGTNGLEERRVHFVRICKLFGI